MFDFEPGLSEAFSDWIREARTEQGLSQERLARFAGVSSTTVRNAERSRAFARLDVADRLVQALGYELVIMKKEPEEQ
jgi:transcriptional regulator with XRE-family HTH domain